MHIFWQRIIRAAKLDSALYEEVEKDTRALPQAMAVVVLSAAAAGIGSISKIGMGGIVVGAVIGLIAVVVDEFIAQVVDHIPVLLGQGHALVGGKHLGNALVPVIDTGQKTGVGQINGFTFVLKCHHILLKKRINTGPIGHRFRKK